MTIDLAASGVSALQVHNPATGATSERIVLPGGSSARFGDAIIYLPVGEVRLVSWTGDYELLPAGGRPCVQRAG